MDVLDNTTPELIPDVSQPEAKQTAPSADIIQLPKTRKTRKTTTSTKPKKNLEELKDTPVSKLTDAEKTELLKFYKEYCAALEIRIDMLDNNAKSAYEKCRTLEQQYADYKLRTTAKLNYARQAVDHCRTSIILAATPDD